MWLMWMWYFFVFTNLNVHVHVHICDLLQVYVNRGDTVTLRCEYELTSGNGVIYIYENSTGTDRILNNLQSSTTYMLIYVEMSYTIENRTEVYCRVNDYVNVPFHRNWTIYEVNGKYILIQLIDHDKVLV